MSQPVFLALGIEMFIDHPILMRTVYKIKFWINLKPISLGIPQENFKLLSFTYKFLSLKLLAILKYFGFVWALES